MRPQATPVGTSPAAAGLLHRASETTATRTGLASELAPANERLTASPARRSRPASRSDASPSDVLEPDPCPHSGAAPGPAAQTLPVVRAQAAPVGTPPSTAPLSRRASEIGGEHAGFPGGQNPANERDSPFTCARRQPARRVHRPPALPRQRAEGKPAGVRANRTRHASPAESVRRDRRASPAASRRRE